MKKIGNLDIILVILLSILCLIFSLTPVLNETVIRVILGILLVLFIPGYSFILVLFPKKEDLDGIERTFLSVVLSISIAPLITLALNYASFGINLIPIIISLSIFTILMSTIAYIRRWKLPEDERFSVNANFKYYFNRILESFNMKSGTDRILSVFLVISIILAVFATAYVTAVPKEGEKFTEFYILGPNGTTGDYSTNLTVGQTGDVTVRIVNHEYSTVNYKMVVKLNNQTVYDKNIILSNNQTYSEPVMFIPYSYGQNHELKFLLYKMPDDVNAYRTLILWLDIK